MVDLVQRPTFFEGQILGAADLTGSLDYARSQMARHQRTLHTSGIAFGLELTGEPQVVDGQNVKVGRLGPGMAIDISGRQIVVPEAQSLNDAAFELVNSGVTDDTQWFPVFLSGVDETATAATVFGDVCGPGAGARISEGFEISFGHLGEEQDLADQPVPGIDAGPTAAPGERAARVLVGYVQWQPAAHRFKDVAPHGGSVKLRYAGVAADEVVARGGTLVLRSRATPQPGTPTMVLDAETRQLQFGPQDARGNVPDPVFTVTADGDVKAKGTFADLRTASVQVESGVATDGVLLPLPAGIAEADVASGRVIVHAHVTPRFDGVGAVPAPRICRVDGRRVHCRVSDGDPATLPGRCDYTLLAVVPTGGS
jgi:hypothetical protein